LDPESYGIGTGLAGLTDHVLVCDADVVTGLRFFTILQNVQQLLKIIDPQSLEVANHQTSFAHSFELYS
jgi:hypothetical protein